MYTVWGFYPGGVTTRIFFYLVHVDGLVINWGLAYMYDWGGINVGFYS